MTDVGHNSDGAGRLSGHRGAVARAVARREADAGIVIDGAGLGSAIAANKVRGIRAAMCSTPTLARYAREHNGANVLALGATLVERAAAKEIVDLWLSTPMREARYIRRLLKVRRLEENVLMDAQSVDLARLIAIVADEVMARHAAAAHTMRLPRRAGGLLSRRGCRA